MNIHFSGSFNRLGVTEAEQSMGGICPSSNWRSLSDPVKSRTAEIEMAASRLAGRIKGEIKNDLQLVYNPYIYPNHLMVKQREGDGFREINTTDERSNPLNTDIRINEGESADAFVSRGIDFAKALGKRLDQIEQRRRSVDAVKDSITGWVVPQVCIDPELALNFGVEKTTALVKTLNKLAPELAALPAGVGLALKSGFKNPGAIRASVVKTLEGDKTKSYNPTSQFSDENRLEQKILWSGESFPRIRIGESDTRFLRRGIAKAQSMIKLEKDIATFEAARDKAIAESHGNFYLPREVVSTFGFEYAQALTEKMKGLSDAIFAVSPQLGLEFLKRTDGKETLRICLRKPGVPHDELFGYSPVLLQETDHERAYCNRRKGESQDKFFARVLDQAASCLKDHFEREALRSRVSSQGDPGLVIA